MAVIELTDAERACGVTEGEVLSVRRRLLVRDGRAILPEATPPAVASAAARLALGTDEVMYAGMALGKMPVYRKRIEL